MFDGVLIVPLNVIVLNLIKKLQQKLSGKNRNFHSVKYIKELKNQNKDEAIFFGPLFRNYF